MTPAKANSAFRHLRSVLLLLLLIVAWGLFAWWVVAQADHEMRANLLQQARIVAQAVNRDQVEALTGTAADLDHPDYHRLKEQFTGVRLTIPQCRYLYLLGRQTDGTVFVFVDSESATAKDYSPPGQVCAEVPAGFRRGFHSKVAAVEGPVRDRGAVWVSAIVPLMHPRKVGVLAVLVVEIGARDWKWMLANLTVLPVGRVLVLLMGGAAYLFALRRPSASRNLKSALSLLAAGLLVTGMLVHYARANAESKALREFELAGNEIRLDILARLHAGAQILHNGAALFDASGFVAREEWRAFTQGLQLEEDLPGIQGLGYASLIPRAQLAAHVAEIRRQGFPDYQVWPGGDRETYSAIIYLEPFTNRNLRAFGYDMLTEPVRRAALEQARDVHAPALTGKVRLIQEDGQNVQAGALMYVPVYRRGWAVETVAQRRAALQGWVYSPYRMADLVQGALRGWDLRFKAYQIDFQVYDGEVVSAATLLYDNRSSETKALAATSGIDRRMPIYFAGHSWTLRFAQPKGLVAMTDYGSSWVALFGGTVISLLLFGVTLSLLTARATAQRMAEQLTQELERMTERHVLAARAGGVGIWDYDVVNNRLIWDDQMFDLYGITRDQFCDTYVAWQTGLHPEDRQRGDEEIHMALRGEKEFNTEFRVIWPDGTTHTLRALATVRRDASGQPTQMIGTNWDITVQKQAAEELRHTNLSLEKANAKAVTLAEQATTANRAKSEFLATMSHEIRTPMNAVLGMNRLLLNTPLDPRQTEFARTVADSGEALLHIINDILDLSKIEAGGHFPIENRPLSLRALTDGVVRLLQPRAEEHGLTLAIDMDEGIPDWLTGDAGRLRQVLVNLAGNSLKFTDRGGVKIRMRLLGTEAFRANLRFEVQDTGIGLSAEGRARLFQPFSQADGTASPQRGGTGLGLAISKHIVELMGGRIGVESVLGQGSVFWFEIALAIAPAPAPEVLVASEADRVQKTSPSRQLRILVAEDNEINRRLLKYTLENLGHQADFAVNGAAAIRAWESSAYDLILMDCQMPEMDGFEATREIRRREVARYAGGGAHIRILAFTANAFSEDRERCLAAGMDDFLSKPCTEDQLREALGTGISSPGLATPPPTPTVGPPSPSLVALDPQRPAKLCAEIGDENAHGLIDDFLADLPGLIAEIRVIAKAGPPSKVGCLAHSLLGISLAFGLVQLGSLLRQIQERAEVGDDVGLVPLLECLPVAAEQARTELCQWREDN